MAAKKVVHIIGTGTIGEPLIGLFLNLREQLELDEVTFHKNRPLLSDRAKVKNLIRRGAKLVVAAEKMSDFEKLGMQPTYEVQQAMDQATVIIDCTPDGVANQHKIDRFQHMPTPRDFSPRGANLGLGSRMRVASTMQHWCRGKTVSSKSSVVTPTTSLCLRKPWHCMTNPPITCLKAALSVCDAPVISARKRVLLRRQRLGNTMIPSLARITRRMPGTCSTRVASIWISFLQRLS